MQVHTEFNHFADGTVADADCERVLTKAGALAAWGRGRVKEFGASSTHKHSSWSAFAEFAEGLPDTDDAIRFFDERGCFDPYLGNTFVAASVPPLDDRHDFLGAVGASKPDDGPTVMEALMRAVLRRERP